LLWRFLNGVIIPDMEKFDAVVVGAGPGGSMAAWKLAEGGAKVLLLERKPEIGMVVQCAEGISHQSLTLFFEPDPRFIASRLNRARFYAPNGDYMEVRKEGVGYILERRVFDRYIAQKAAEAGAEILTNATFTRLERKGENWLVHFSHKGKNEIVECRLVIGADGPGSNVGRQAGLKLDLEPEDYHYVMEYFMVHPAIEDGRADFFTGDEYCHKGYGWSFPKGGHYGNVGVGVALVPPEVGAKPYLERFVNTYFKGAKILGVISSVVPVGGHKMEIYGDGIMVVGDAARLAEPISGGGIPAALLSGSIAGEVGAKALKEGNLSKSRLKEYHDRFWEKINRREYELAYEVRKVFLKMDDNDIQYLFDQLKPLFHNKDLDTVNATEIAKFILTTAPNLLLFAAKKGGAQFVDYLKRAVFG
jgi:digeranylgeranylglycerophospholipid reductase